MTDTKIVAKMQCTRCGHIQLAKGFRVSEQEGGGTYFGSAYRFCDECDDFPKEISREEFPKQENS